MPASATSSGIALDGLDSDRRPNLWRYLPLSLLATCSVIVLPAALSAALIPRGGPALTVLSSLAAVAVSLALAALEAWAWKRRPQSSDIVFADLMLWGWVRRYWAEDRLARAQRLYEGARNAGPAVSIELLTSLSTLLLSRDAYTQGHSERVARHAERIARTMGLSPAAVARVRTAAAVHDVGKLYTPRKILTNPRRLSGEELEVMRRHASDGARMLAHVGDPEIADMVRHHHERVDGTGYPDGLVGSQIPLGARIIAVADTFDSITSNRAYRSADTHKHALDVLCGEAGAQLDADAVGAFMSDYAARRPIAWLALATTGLQRAAAALHASSGALGGALGGVAAILPAAGAAAVLALSPALHHKTASSTSVHRGPGAAPIARSHAPVAARTPVTSAPRRAGGPVSGIRAPSLRDGGHSGAQRPTAPSNQPTTGAPSTTPPAAKTPAGSASSPGAGEAGSTGGSPRLPSRPISPSPNLPIAGAPPLPSLPATPPVTLPSITIPGASTPSITTPSVQTPVGGLPPVSTPSLSLPSITTPSVSVAGLPQIAITIDGRSGG